MQIKAWHLATLCCLSTFVVLFLLSFFASSRGSDRGSEGSSQKTTVTSSHVGLDIGDTAPAFQFVSTEETMIRSASLKGDIIVMTSAAVWCPSCAAEAFQLAAVYAQHRDDPVTFITIDIDSRNSVELINQFRKDNITPWFYGQALAAEALIDDYRLNRFEITYVIDRDGIIRYKDTWTTSTVDLVDVLNQLL